MGRGPGLRFIDVYRRERSHRPRSALAERCCGFLPDRNGLGGVAGFPVPSS